MQGAWIRYTVILLIMHELLRILNVEWKLSREQMIGSGGKRVDVCPKIDVVRRKILFWRHVQRTADDGLGGGVAVLLLFFFRLLDIAGDAEIADDDTVARIGENLCRRVGRTRGTAVDHEIVRLQILMDEAFLVDVGKAFDDVRQNAYDDCVIQSAETSDEILYVHSAGNVLHDDEDMVRSRDDVIA